LERPFTFEERYDLAADIDSLPLELLDGVVDLLAEGHPFDRSSGLQIPIEKVKVSTLRRIQAYVKDALPKVADVRKMRQASSPQVTPQEQLDWIKAEKSRLWSLMKAKPPDAASSETTSGGSSESGESRSGSGDSSSESDD
jgi:hypothetical protein